MPSLQGDARFTAAAPALEKLLVSNRWRLGQEIRVLDSGQGGGNYLPWHCTVLANSLSLFETCPAHVP